MSKGLKDNSILALVYSISMILGCAAIVVYVLTYLGIIEGLFLFLTRAILYFGMICFAVSAISFIVMIVIGKKNAKILKQELLYHQKFKEFLTEKGIEYSIAKAVRNRKQFNGSQLLETNTIDKKHFKRYAIATG